MRNLTLPALLIALALPVAAHAQHSHEAHAHDTTKLQLNHGKKWRTDAPLRKGIAGMRATTVDAIDRIHQGKATDASLDAAAKAINGHLANIVQECKLAPAADAQLHIVIGKIMAANEALEGKAKGQARADGAVALARALNQYGEYFDDPAFKPIDIQH